ncbi:DUF3107 domain-containing protein [Gordonia sp. TBRC 11910]|uniref:DUF3107 domain-containing protein n=1 Tax=Gordonia asplenii TaxID=2725283 RepID=A0A848KV52_9ACTN|nr:DUF3107 domain-containing protein [Gordonia asplenii]NMO01917.1 DUF3107 domain-containing protein [Gordonia asplenii]
MSVEVKIGISDSPRELTIQSADSSDDVYAAIETALGGKSALLALTDEKGARFVVPVTKIAYVEVGKSESRKVGFGAA